MISIFDSENIRVNLFSLKKAKIWGPPDGHPVFALHGWLDNAGSFDALIPLLPSNLRIVAVDTVNKALFCPYCYVIVNVIKIFFRRLVMDSATLFLLT